MDKCIEAKLEEMEKIMVGDGAPCEEMVELEKKLDEKFDTNTWDLDEQLWKIFDDAVTSDNDGGGHKEMEQLAETYMRANFHDRVAMDLVSTAMTGWSIATMLKTAAAGLDSCKDYTESLPLDA